MAMQLTNLRNIYEIFVERQRKRRRNAYFIIGLLAVGYCLMTYFVVTRPKPDYEQMVVPQIKAEPSETASASSTPVFKPSTYHRSTAYSGHSVSVPAMSMRSVNNHSGSGAAVKVYSTSSAAPKSVGSGAAATGGGSSSGTVVSTAYARASAGQSTSAILSPSLPRLSRRSLTADNIVKAEQQVIDQNGPRAVSSRIRRDGWDDYGQDDEPFLDPIGEGMWLLVALAAAYAMFILYRRKQRV